MCHLTITWMSNIKEKSWKTRLPVSVNLLIGTAYAPTGKTASLDDHEHSNSSVLISTVLRLATLRVTELHYDWATSSLIVPRRTPNDNQKCSPPIPVFGRCWCCPPWLTSHLLSLSLWTPLPGRFWRSSFSLTEWTCMHATVWIFKETRIRPKHPEFGWKWNTLHHSLNRTTLWEEKTEIDVNMNWRKRKSDLNLGSATWKKQSCESCKSCRAAFLSWKNQTDCKFFKSRVFSIDIHINMAKSFQIFLS